MSWVEDQFQAMLARLRADTVLADRTFDGDVTGSPQSWVVLTGNDGDMAATRLAGQQDSADTVFGLRAVGLTRKQAQDLSARAKAQLLGPPAFRPVVSGRCYPGGVRHLSSQQAVPDDETPQHLWVASSLFLLHSDPSGL